MVRLLQRIEYNDRAENWALGVISSARMLVLGTKPGVMGRERLGEIWALCIDAADRLVDGQRRTKGCCGGGARSSRRGPGKVIRIMIEPTRVSALLITFGIAGSLASCTTREGTMDTEALQELGTRYTAAWNSGDPTRVASHFAETGSLKVNDAEPAVGREAIAAVAEGFMTAFPDMELLMDSVRTTPSGEEYHWTFIGTNTGPGGTGNAVRFSGYEAWTLTDDGLITRSLGHFDEDEYNRQLEQGVAGADPS